MLKLSKKVEYALIALMHMDSQSHGSLTTAREISDQYSVPGELLGKILQLLTRAGLVGSEQGAHGGYRLLKPLDGVTLGEVLEAIEGPVHLACCDEDPECCEQFSTCNIKKPVLAVQKQLVSYMYSLPLSSFRGSMKMPAVTVASH